jgi:pyruvate dehydrogenase E2 component (dihydrolipoamide acetyltransferase)
VASAVEIKVPDIGGFKDVSVIDVLVKAGQSIEKETPLITVETEKAAMDVPAPAAGKVAEVRLKTGDKVSEGSVILLLESSDADGKPALEAAPPPQVLPEARATTVAKQTPAPSRSEPVPETPPHDDGAAANASPLVAIDESGFSKSHASPSVRRFARELGADLAAVQGSGVKGRIMHEDVKAHVKQLLSTGGAARAPSGGVATSAGLPKLPVVDHAAFGPVEVKPLSRIQKISGARLQASWINLPHVTQNEDADITDLETARNQLKSKAQQEGVKLTPLAFIIRAVILALKQHPRFNASLDASGENLVYKKYFNIGFAADTENGLVVPVIPNADRLNLFGIAHALAEYSEKARAGKLKATEMQGGSFTISSLGGIGGTAFTPIINAPEVAILGVARSSLKPVYDRGGFIPRLILPLCLSYDHRVIDGAEAARFVVTLARALGDPQALQ